MSFPFESTTFDRMHPTVGSRPRAPSVRLVLDVPAVEDDWILSDDLMPESVPHHDTLRLLELILLAFIARARRNALVAVNLACRWDAAKPNVGVDPDVALIEPAPPDTSELESLRTWLPGHVPPRFAIEVVSRNNPEKDYVDAPAKYARLGTRELVVFDPALRGPAVLDGPYLLQVWRRDEGGSAMTRVYAGDGPARSEELGAWLVPTGDARLRIADDPGGQSLWLTEAETHAAARSEAESTLRTVLCAAVEDLCELAGVPLDDARRAHLATLEAADLEALRAQVKRNRAWPA
jgi:Uma2 family endonuclease